MNLKTDTEINELIKCIKWYGRLKSDEDTISWLDEYMPNWREVHDINITYSEQIGTND